MEDREIVELYWQRKEEALAESQGKYGGLCRSVALGVLGSPEDAEEAFSDALLRAWNSIPPNRPAYLDAYLAKLCRRAAIDRLRHDRAGKRWGGEAALALEELEDCVPGGGGAEAALEAVLDAHGIFYNKSEVWIDSEKLYEVLYQFEMEGMNNA